MKVFLKKQLFLVLIVFLALFTSWPILTYASDTSLSGDTEEIREDVLDEIINEQKSTLNISTFIKEANEYTKETFP